MKFILSVTTTGDGNLGWSGIAVVDLEKHHIKELFARRELFQMVKSKDANLVDMFFVDTTNCCYYENADLAEVLNDNEHALFELEEVMAFIDTSRDEDLEAAIGDMERTEVDQVVIDDVGVRFHAGLKHSDECIESVYIKYDQLLTSLRACL